MFAVQMAKKTLTEFLNEEMKRRGMSARQFADLVGINHALVNKFANNVPSDDIGYPSIHTLRKLSDATGVSMLTMIALTFPDAENLDSDIEARLLAEQYKQISPDDQTVVRRFINDALSKRKKK